MKAYIPVLDLKTEEAVLGRMMISQEAAQTAGQLLRPTDFFHGIEQELFKEILYLRKRGCTDLASVYQGLCESPEARRPMNEIVGPDRIITMISAGLRKFKLKSMCRYLVSIAELRALFPETPAEREPYATHHPSLAALAVQRHGEFLGMHTIDGRPMYVFRRPPGITIDQLIEEVLGDSDLGRYGILIESLLMMDPETDICKTGGLAVH